MTEPAWREATARVPHFCISESPAYTGRAVAALAADPQVGENPWRHLARVRDARDHG